MTAMIICSKAALQPNSNVTTSVSLIQFRNPCIFGASRAKALVFGNSGKCSPGLITGFPLNIRSKLIFHIFPEKKEKKKKTSFLSRMFRGSLLSWVGWDAKAALAPPVAPQPADPSATSSGLRPNRTWPVKPNPLSGANGLVQKRLGMNLSQV